MIDKIEYPSKRVDELRQKHENDHLCSICGLRKYCEEEFSKKYESLTKRLEEAVKNYDLHAARGLVKEKIDIFEEQIKYCMENTKKTIDLFKDFSFEKLQKSTQTEIKY